MNRPEIPEEGCTAYNTPFPKTCVMVSETEELEKRVKIEIILSCIGLIDRLKKSKVRLNLDILQEIDRIENLTTKISALSYLINLPEHSIKRTTRKGHERKIRYQLRRSKK